MTAVLGLLLVSLAGCREPAAQPQPRDLKIGDLRTPENENIPGGLALRTANFDVHIYELPADKAAKDRTNGLVHELGRRFASLHGSLRCKDLLGCDLNTEEGQAQFKAQKLRDTKCLEYVRDACRLLEEMLPERKA